MASNYVKNLKSSFKYIVKDVGEEYTSNIRESADNIRDSIETTKEQYQKGGGVMKTTANMIKDNQMFRDIKKISEDMFNRLKTGNLYESDSAAFDGMEDYELTDYDDVYADEDEGTDDDSLQSKVRQASVEVDKSEKEKVSDGKMTSTAVIDASEALSTSITETQKALHMDQKLTDSVHFGEMKSSLSNIDTRIETLNKFNDEVQKDFIEQSVQYYEDNMNVLNEMKGVMTEYMVMEEDPVEKTTDEAKNFLDHIMSGNLIKGAKQFGGHVFSALAPLSMQMALPMISSMLPNIIQMYAMEPGRIIKDLAKGGLNKYLGFDALEKFDSLTGDTDHLIQSVAGKAAFSDNEAVSSIAKQFIDSSRIDKSMSTSDYNPKARTFFDGQTKKAITEVIPTYLRKILSAVSDQEEIVYDYKSGKYNTVSEIESSFYGGIPDFEAEYDKISGLVRKNIGDKAEIKDEEALTEAVKKLTDGLLDSGHSLADIDAMNYDQFRRTAGMSKDEISEDEFSLIKGALNQAKQSDEDDSREVFHTIVNRMRDHHGRVSDYYERANKDSDLTGLNAIMDDSFKLQGATDEDLQYDVMDLDSGRLENQIKGMKFKVQSAQEDIEEYREEIEEKIPEGTSLDEYLAKSEKDSKKLERLEKKKERLEGRLDKYERRMEHGDLEHDGIIDHDYSEEEMGRIIERMEEAGLADSAIANFTRLFNSEFVQEHAGDNEEVQTYQEAVDRFNVDNITKGEDNKVTKKINETNKKLQKANKDTNEIMEATSSDIGASGDEDYDKNSLKDTVEAVGKEMDFDDEDTKDVFGKIVDLAGAGALGVGVGMISPLPIALTGVAGAVLSQSGTIKEKIFGEGAGEKTFTRNLGEMLFGEERTDEIADSITDTFTNFQEKVIDPVKNFFSNTIGAAFGKVSDWIFGTSSDEDADSESTDSDDSDSPDTDIIEDDDDQEAGEGLYDSIKEKPKNMQRFGKGLHYFAQDDSSYGDLDLGSGSTVQESGCGLMCAAMAVSNVVDEEVEPDELIDIAKKYKIDNDGISLGFFKDVANRFGIPNRVYSKSEISSKALDDVIEDGNMVISLYEDSSGGLHYILVRKCSGKNYYVDDPARGSSLQKSKRLIHAKSRNFVIYYQEDLESKEKDGEATSAPNVVSMDDYRDGVSEKVEYIDEETGEVKVIEPNDGSAKALQKAEQTSSSIKSTSKSDTTLGDINETLEEGFNGVPWNIEYIKRLLVEKFGDLDEEMEDGDIATNKLTKFKGFFGKLKDKAFGLPKKLFGKAKEKIDNILEIPGKVIKGVKDRVTKVVKFPFKLMGKVRDGITDFVKNISEMKDAVIERVGKIKDGIVDWWDETGRETLKNIGKGIWDTAVSIKDKSLEIADDLYEGSKKLIGDIYGGLTDFWNESKEDLIKGTKKVLTDVYDGGKKLLGDVYGGLKSAGGWALDKLKGAGGWMADKAKGALDWGKDKASGILDKIKPMKLADQPIEVHVTGGTLDGVGAVGAIDMEMFEDVRKLDRANTKVEEDDDGVKNIQSEPIDHTDSNVSDTIKREQNLVHKIREGTKNRIEQLKNKITGVFGTRDKSDDNEDEKSEGLFSGIKDKIFDKGSDLLELGGFSYIKNKLFGKAGGKAAGKAGGKVAGKVGGKVGGKVAGKVGGKVAGKGVMAKAGAILPKALGVLAKGGAILAKGFALVSNPVGWAVAAGAALSFVIYKFRDQIGGFINGVGERLSSFGSFINERVLDPIRNFREGMRNFMGNLARNIIGDERYESIINTVNTVRNRINEFGSQIYHFRDSIMELPGRIKDGVSAGIDRFRQGLSDFGSSVSNLGSDIYDNTIGRVRDGFDTLMDNVSKAIKWVQDLLPDWMVDGVGEAKEMASDVKDAATNKIDNAKETVGNIKDGVTEGISNFGNTLSSMLSDDSTEDLDVVEVKSAKEHYRQDIGEEKVEEDNLGKGIDAKGSTDVNRSEDNLGEGIDDYREGVVHSGKGEEMDEGELDEIDTILDNIDSEIDDQDSKLDEKESDLEEPDLDIDKYGAGNISHIYQKDPKFDGLSIGGYNFSDIGCGPSVVGMALSNQGEHITEEELAKLAGKYSNEQGVRFDYIGDMMSMYGVPGKTVGKDIPKHVRNISNGEQAILLTKNSSGGGHYVLVEKEGDKVRVHDPLKQTDTLRSPNSSIVQNTESAYIIEEAGAGAKDPTATTDITEKITDIDKDLMTGAGRRAVETQRKRTRMNTIDRMKKAHDRVKSVGSSITDRIFNNDRSERVEKEPVVIESEDNNEGVEERLDQLIEQVENLASAMGGVSKYLMDQLEQTKEQAKSGGNNLVLAGAGGDSNNKGPDSFINQIMDISKGKG